MRFKVNVLRLEMERIWQEWSCQNACHFTKWITLGGERSGFFIPKKGRLSYPKEESLKSLRKRLGILSS